jgi:transketolase
VLIHPVDGKKARFRFIRGMAMPLGIRINSIYREDFVTTNTAGISSISSFSERGCYAPNASDLTFDARVARLERIAKVMRRNVVDMVYIAQSGHIGGAFSAADIVTALYFDLMNIDPANPRWADRDRFVLSKGHACPIWYSALALRGFFPVDELKTLRKNDSRLQGHPIATYLPGLDASAGSLGLGFAQAVGIAMEAKFMARDYRVYVMLGDGEINEGVVWETSLAAAKYKLDNLVAIVDVNNLQLDGTLAEVMPTEPMDAKFRAFGFDVLAMDGHDMADVLMTLSKARGTHGGKPVCVLAHTVKGKGVSFMEHQVDWHGKAPNDEQYKKACAELEGAEA